MGLGEAVRVRGGVNPAVPSPQSDPSVVRQLMSNAIADWYLHTDSPQDHSKLSRVLDVMQDLKALFTLLNNTQFSFVVDLACLAAKREYLKLDTWIMDRIREHHVRARVCACVRLCVHVCVCVRGTVGPGVVCQ